MSDLDEAVNAALDATWSKIQALEPGVPNAVWYLTSGRSSSCATGPWKSPGDLLLRINLKQGHRPEGRNLTGKELLAQLMHWAAHAKTHTISPGAEGRYHSRDFGEVGEKLGLQIKQTAGLGWPPVMTGGSEVLTLQAEKAFRAEIKALDRAMAEWEAAPEEAAGTKRVRGPVALACKCDPPRLLRATTGIALGPGIRCEQCSELFRIRPGQRISEADRQ
jgi:hypothetical protein